MQDLSLNSQSVLLSLHSLLLCVLLDSEAEIDVFESVDKQRREEEAVCTFLCVD